jgi:hypothetical protein
MGEYEGSPTMLNMQLNKGFRPGSLLKAYGDANVREVNAIGKVIHKVL